MVIIIHKQSIEDHIHDTIWTRGAVDMLNMNKNIFRNEVGVFIKRHLSQ